MRRLLWPIFLSLVLLALSGLLSWGHYLLFHDLRQLGFYLLLDLAFVPIQVLFVSFIVDQLLARREQAAMLEKLNMAVGAFFAEVGADLLKICAAFDTEPEAIRGLMAVRPAWRRADFGRTLRKLKTLPFKLYSQQGDLAHLGAALAGKRTFLLTLLQNPSLLEHETFTQMLWAVFHLSDELAHRRDLTALSKPDYDHLSGDLQRAYAALCREWLGYMRHLQTAYPYLFSLAVRVNPFDPAAAAEFPDPVRRPGGTGA